jgi:hypothetical protein
MKVKHQVIINRIPFPAVVTIVSDEERGYQYEARANGLFGYGDTAAEACDEITFRSKKDSLKIQG